MNALRGLEISRGYRDRTPEAGRRAHLGGNDGASGSDAHPLREAHAVDRRRVSREPSRRPRDLDLRRARQGRDDASGLPQHGADDRAPLRRAARPGAQGRAHDRRPTPAAAASRTRSIKASRNAEDLVGARDAIAEWARVTYGWIGRSPDYKAAFLATLGANSGYYAPYDEQREQLVQEVPGRGVLRQPRHRQPAGRSRQAARRSERRLHARREGDRRRPDRERRQGGRDDLEL